MKVQISRASEDILSDARPIEDVRLEKYTRIDIRCCSCVEELYCTQTRENWFKLGTNHRIIDGCIARDFIDGGEGWFVEISSVESFIKEFGACVVRFTLNGWLMLHICNEL